MASCLNFKSVDLQTHQKIPSVFIKNPLNRGLLLFFNLGTGKSLTSIAMAHCLLTKYPNKRVIVLTPASLVTNYQNEIKKVKSDLQENVEKIKVHSYVKFINSLKEHQQAGNNTILIIDEAQNFLSPSSIRYQKLFNFSKTAYKVILLSATPVRNQVSEISNELSLLNGYKISKTLIEKINNIPDEKIRIENLKKFIGCKVMFYEKPKEGNFPERIDHTVELIMGKDYYQTYFKIQKDIKTELHDIFKSTDNLKAFLNGIRKASNIVLNDYGSPKVKWIINKIKKDLENDKKVLVYSNFLGAGIDLLRKELNELKIGYSLVIGKLTQKQKEENIKRYNEGKVKVIIISSSGAEGLNLKATRSVIIMERTWNNSKLEQVIGRAIRLNSHMSLPPHQRKVDVYNLILVKPAFKNKGDDLGSADQILQRIANNKQRSISEFYNNLKQLSIEKHPSCF